MLKQQIVIDVQGETQDELNAAIKAAGTALAIKEYSEVTAGSEANFSISSGSLQATLEWDPNSLYVLGTNQNGEVTLCRIHSTSDADKDYDLMSTALSLSNAVAQHGVEFKERKLGSLLVRPEPKAKPPRDVVQQYDLVHITDLVKLDDGDIAEFASDLPGLIAMLKLAKDECDQRGTKLTEVMPKLQYVADSSGTVTLRSKTESITAHGSDIVAGYKRELAAGDSQS
ncbi:hypothetical protein WJ97_11535 [Burkholderia ubonensis]|uniref:hypothetical protein n=1 Tax=Burkholderia ubonensis TaxID=101571 RepID=UPI00075999E1|nr:hypothetical protein [Burkholderia ubonensis]KVP96512.1 hypothetical protein WJ97_11535 [Burkholderia ubonensis]